eukprot:28317-Rhodomonas_salina.8
MSGTELGDTATRPAEGAGDDEDSGADTRGILLRPRYAMPGTWVDAANGEECCELSGSGETGTVVACETAGGWQRTVGNGRAATATATALEQPCRDESMANGHHHVRLDANGDEDQSRDQHVESGQCCAGCQVEGGTGAQDSEPAVGLMVEQREEEEERYASDDQEEDEDEYGEQEMEEEEEEEEDEREASEGGEDKEEGGCDAQGGERGKADANDSVRARGGDLDCLSDDQTDASVCLADNKVDAEDRQSYNAGANNSHAEATPAMQNLEDQEGQQDDDVLRQDDSPSVADQNPPEDQPERLLLGMERQASEAG